MGDDKIHLVLPDHQVEDVTQARVEDTGGGIDLVAACCHVAPNLLSLSCSYANGERRHFRAAACYRASPWILVLCARVLTIGFAPEARHITAGPTPPHPQLR